MRRTLYTINLENGAIWEKVESYLIANYPRRRRCAYRKNDKTYTCKINLDADEISALLDFFGNLETEHFTAMHIVNIKPALTENAETHTIELYKGARVETENKATECKRICDIWDCFGWDIQNDANAKECASIITRELICFGFIDLTAMNNGKKLTITLF